LELSQKRKTPLAMINPNLPVRARCILEYNRSNQGGKRPRPSAMNLFKELAKGGGGVRSPEYVTHSALNKGQVRRKQALLELIVNEQGLGEGHPGMRGMPCVLKKTPSNSQRKERGRYGTPGDRDRQDSVSRKAGNSPPLLKI